MKNLSEEFHIFEIQEKKEGKMLEGVRKMIQILQKLDVQVVGGFKIQKSEKKID